MARDCCLAGVDHQYAATLRAVLGECGLPDPPIVTPLTVADIGRIAPDVLICDIDAVNADPLELLRQLRFVLPSCTIAVFTGRLSEHWATECHLAGANCLLSQGSTEAQLSEGVRSALRSGCYTDPRFALAQHAG